MTISRRAAALTLVLLLAGTARAEKSAERLGSNVVPTFQSIHLDVDPARPTYEGSVRIELRVTQATDSFRFHSEGPAITRLVLTGRAGGIGVEHAPESDDVVRVRAARELAPGAYTLEIDFEHAFGTQAVGLYRVEQEDAAYLFTQFEADDAREAFPCWDEPIFKIPFQMTLTVPQGDLAITNTPEESERVEGDRRTVVFRRTKPLPTYLLALAVGPLETAPIEGLGVPGRVVAPKGQIHLAGVAQEMTPPILAALEEYFDSPYPYEKLDLIAVPEFWPGAMEHPGAITYRDNGLLLDPATSSVREYSRLARWTAHELAHQWFGNLVTMEWWDDLWLNEAFADWMGDKIAEQVHPEYGIAVGQLSATQRLMARDAQPSSKPIRREFEPDSSLMQDVGLTYFKGKYVLSMFERWMGSEVFRRGVLDYLAENAWGNATAGDLWRALDRATGRDVSGALAGFLEQPGVPRLRAEIVGGNRVRITQSRFHNAGVEMEELRWKVPVMLRYSDGARVRTESLLLEGEVAELALETKGDLAWLYPNAGAAGYYRWSMEPDRLAALADAAERVLSPRERIELLGNAGALFGAGEISGRDHIRLLHRFARDPEPQVVSSTMGGLRSVRTTFVTDELEPDFAIFARRTFRPALERFGLDKVEGEDELVTNLRGSLYNWLGDYGRDPVVRNHARRLAASYLEDPTSVDPSVAGISLGLTALDGDLDLFETFRTRFESTRDPSERSRFLTLLGGFRDPALQERALAYVFEGPLRPQEVFTIPFGMLETEAGRERVFDWMMDSFDAIRERVPPDDLAFLPFFGGGCSRDRFERMLEFFADEERMVAGTETRIARVRDSVDECLYRRESDGPDVARYLREFAEAAES